MRAQVAGAEDDTSEALMQQLGLALHSHLEQDDNGHSLAHRVAHRLVGRETPALGLADAQKRQRLAEAGTALDAVDD